MALIDYGAILRVNGKFINKNCDLFMHSSDTGYVCEQALHPNGEMIDIDKEFYVYAGDENFMLCFYKGLFYVISHNKIILAKWNILFMSETFYFDGLPSVNVERLDNKTQRWLATWIHNGNKYEVIFGYGIDPDEEVWNRIKFDGYKFTDIEREIIDEWFKEG